MYFGCLMSRICFFQTVQRHHFFNSPSRCLPFSPWFRSKPVAFQNFQDVNRIYRQFSGFVKQNRPNIDIEDEDESLSFFPCCEICTWREILLNFLWFGCTWKSSFGRSNLENPPAKAPQEVMCKVHPPCGQLVHLFCTSHQVQAMGTV